MIATQQRKAKPYRTGYVPHTVPHTVPHVEEHDDTLMSKEEFFAKIDAALEDVRQGKGIVINSKEELHAYFDSL